MPWRPLTSPWRFRIPPFSNPRRRERPLRCNSTQPAGRPQAPTRRRPPDPTKGPPQVNHARLLGNGKPYHDQQLAGELKVAGLIRSIRRQKHQAFAHIDDGTTYAPMQAVLPPELAKDLTNGAYVELLGNWRESPAKGQSHELYVASVLSVGESNPDENPIQKQAMTVEYLRSIPHMRIRTPFHSLLARTRSHIVRSVSDHFEFGRRQPVVQVHPPLITSSDCEGAGEVFTISPRSHAPLPNTAAEGPGGQPNFYFRESKYLTVSSQLHLESWAAQLGDVWALSPTFRAEESDTSRHLSEFYMLEAEFRGQNRLEAVTGRVESMIKWIMKDLRLHQTGKELLEYSADRKHRPADVNAVDLEQRWAKLEGEFITVTYTNAIEELAKAHAANDGHTFKFRPDWHNGLQIDHERWIVENLGRGLPTFVTHYPRNIKPFYMLPTAAADPSSESPPPPGSSLGDTVACFDLLLPHGYCEVAGGSLREHRLEQLVASMRDKGLLKRTVGQASAEYPYLQPEESLGSLQWYADLRRYGSSRHGGFGLGFDRLLAYLTGVSNVREVVGYPRSWGRADC